MKHRRNRLVGLFPGALVILLLPVWALAAERLVILSPNGEGIRYEFGRAFSEWHEEKFGEPVEVDWRDLGGASADMKFVLSEFKSKPDGIGLDLLFGGGTDNFIDLNGRHLLESYQPPAEVLKAIPAQIGGVPIYDPEFHWFGAALSSFGILYNKRVLELQHLPVINTWRELAEQAPIGSVGSGDPRNSGTMHMMYELILQRYGWEDGWRMLTLLAGKVRAFDPSAATIAKDCEVGNTAYALAIDFYAIAQIENAGRENMGFVIPGDCAVINPDALAILRGAPHLTTAQRFIEFTLSAAGQRLWMLPLGYPGGAKRFSILRMSILPDLYKQYQGVTPVAVDPFSQTNAFQYNARKGSSRTDILNGLCGATLVDVHEELVAALKRTGRIDGTPPMSEAVASGMSTNEWSSPHFRQRKQTEWQLWAKHKYESLTPDNH